MLEKNVQIRIAPDLEQFDLIYQTTLHRTNPIIIYCFESLDQHLTEIDHQHLSELKRRLPSMPIFFTQITDFDISYGKFTHSLIDCFTKSHRCVSSPQSSCCKVKSSSESNPHNCKYQCLSACGQLIKSSQLDYDHSQIDCFKNYQNQIIDFEIDDQNEQSQKQKISKNYSKQLETKKVIKNLKFEENSSAQDLDHNHLMPRELNRSCCVRLEKEKNKSIKVEEQCENQTRSNSIQKQLNELSFFQKIYLQALRRDFSDQYKQTRENSCSQSRKDIDESFCPCDKQATVEDSSVDSHFIDRLHQFGKFITFFRMLIKSNLVVAATLLNEFQNRFTQEFIFSAFDMTWNLNYSIPKRLEYVKNKEAKLYMSLLGIANRKQDEIKQIIAETLQFIRDDILEQASNYNFTIHRLNHNNQDHRDNSSTIVSAAETKQCIMEIQDFVFMTLNRAIAIKLIGSIDVMHESFIGELCKDQHQTITSRFKISSKRNEKIDQALFKLLNLAYSIEINANTCSSALRSLWNKFRNFFFAFNLKPSGRIDSQWKRQICEELLDNLSENKLTKCICLQFQENLKNAHETFLNSLSILETSLMERLKEMDQRRQQVRKKDAPVFARLALESSSLIDAILYGPPEVGKEIGRGQYGVVFTAKKSWANFTKIAVKSIMICDDKHWNDLAMEFYYTRSLPPNDRIVQIRGSIIEHNSNSSSSFVYLIMDRLNRDLYAGLKIGLDWLKRLQIAIDVVHGLRFLHNNGLIHRDVKLKNVLLDENDRAKITDLGFCKSEVMINGSIVGTPIHMAPEVFTGKYDSTVDIYAFGILFWYICSGSVELPLIFEQCHNKDHLWIAVKKGLRPEKLPIFDNECFDLMERCWAGDPIKRPLLGEVEQTLLSINERFLRKNSH
ncbi:dual specificity protein kinase-like protein [Sarcoptes scabiei]|uniref:Dual serine/threonine and tyrosine protein kinase n=1 Tax=Sarcoptes scabiei TaxID=52283 RepID=A0A132AGU2_SARSC|nr:dual specificity protein kinase-like protein [Sarcoptes scabiei]